MYKLGRFFISFFLLLTVVRPDYSSAKSTYYIFSGPKYNAGMFSVFTGALGFLNVFDAKKQVGFEFNFGHKGLYYDREKGENWWSYYFEPIKKGRSKNKIKRVIRDDNVRSLSWSAALTMDRKRAYQLINKYVKVKPHIRQKVAKFVKTKFQDNYMIGVHFRGTDKIFEAPRVPYERMRDVITKAVTSLNTDRYKIFVATDEQAFLDYINQEFPGKIVSYDSYRSKDDKPIHFRGYGQYKMGEDALLDCLLLSKSKYLIRTESNLSLCAGYFNPTVPIEIVRP